jgi:predicted acyl esterase
VRLFDVNETGVETTSPHSLTEGWVRASYRSYSGMPEKIVPGEIYEYSFKLPEIANVFKAGHRIKLDITSMSSGKDPDAHTSSYVLSISKPTTHRIYRDAEHKSRIILPVIPKG